MHLYFIYLNVADGVTTILPNALEPLSVTPSGRRIKHILLSSGVAI